MVVARYPPRNGPMVEPTAKLVMMYPIVTLRFAADVQSAVCYEGKIKG